MKSHFISDERTFLQTYAIALAVVAVLLLLVGGGIGLYFFSGKVPAPRKPDEIMVRLLPPPLPPPPPPPPPPKIQPPPEPKMVEQPKVEKLEAKPKVEAKLDKPPGPPGPKAGGPPSDDGIGGAGGGGDGLGGGGGGGSRFGWYAEQVQERVASALHQNGKTRAASLRLKVRIWSDATGTVTRAELQGTTGDSDVDAAIKNEVLTGLRLQEPPPQDMPMPIVMMISEQRPS